MIILKGNFKLEIGEPSMTCGFSDSKDPNCKSHEFIRMIKVTNEDLYYNSISICAHCGYCVTIDERKENPIFNAWLKKRKIGLMSLYKRLLKEEIC